MYKRYFEQEEETQQEKTVDTTETEEKDFPKERMYQKVLSSIYEHIYNGLLEDLLNYQEAATTFMEPEFIEILEGTIEKIKEAVSPLEEYTKDLSGEQ